MHSKWEKICYTWLFFLHHCDILFFLTNGYSESTALQRVETLILTITQCFFDYLVNFSWTLKSRYNGWFSHLSTSIKLKANTHSNTQIHKYIGLLNSLLLHDLCWYSNLFPVKIIISCKLTCKLLQQILKLKK